MPPIRYPPQSADNRKFSVGFIQMKKPSKKESKRRIADERETEELIKEAHQAVMGGYADDEQHALAFRGAQTW